ncbi:MAG: bifunctional proline dehydrogenase/L-glutamate gamma-semialdehyde dehydrogenase PutA, partial [Parvibaculales bacterium]
MPNTKTMAKLSAAYLADEADIVAAMPQAIGLTQRQRLAISASAAQLVKDIRNNKTSRSAIDDLLQEYGLSSAEGVVLMRLAEALIRTPDFATSRRLIRDKIEAANWTAHRGKSASFLVNQATTGLRVTAAWVAATGGVEARNLSAKLGDRVMARAVDKAVAIMGDHFVLGQTIAQARHRAHANEAKGVTHSYDMLGEAAYTHADADAYFAAYMEAMQDLAATADTNRSGDIVRAAGLSIKLSALHPRYEYAQRDTCVPILVERITALARIAKQAGLWLTIDAEEADRMEISLLVFEKLLREPSLADWVGLGLVVQAYQRRALPLIDYLISLAKSTQRKIAVRLVKGAYWDMEIKRAQELGLASYPVFTRKENTDVSYLACARKLLAARAVIFPQFATHNAHSAAAVAAMATSMDTTDGQQPDYEFQRLHGMGAALHAQLMARFGVASRIYAPVGKHRDLLAYLVRRLLENGANNSFVNQVLDEEVAIDDIVSCPIAAVAANQTAANPRIVPPADIVEAGRVSAFGIDLTQAEMVAKTTHAMTKSAGVVYHAASRINGQAMAGESKDIFSPQDTTQKIGTADYAPLAQVATQIDVAVRCAQQSDWANGDTRTNNPQERAAIFAKAADLLEQEMANFLSLLVQEAGKTLPDALSELREAVDFCRYYGKQAQRCYIAARAPLGIIACISPW